MVYSAEYIKKKLEQEMILSQAFGRDLVNDCSSILDLLLHCLLKLEEAICFWSIFGCICWNSLSCVCVCVRVFVRVQGKGTMHYGLVIVGHSLGAGTAAILSFLLRPQYPTLQCYSYSPPGGLLRLVS